jgi:hypothetical protein
MTSLTVTGHVAESCGNIGSFFWQRGCAVETVETVSIRSLLSITPLKRGVNEKQPRQSFPNPPAPRQFGHFADLEIGDTRLRNASPRQAAGLETCATTAKAPPG